MNWLRKNYKNTIILLYAHIDTCRHTQGYTRRHTQTPQPHARRHTLTYRPTYRHTHRHTQTRQQIQTHTQTHIETDTHRHTDTQAFYIYMQVLNFAPQSDGDNSTLCPFPHPVWLCSMLIHLPFLSFPKIALSCRRNISL